MKHNTQSNSSRPLRRWIPLTALLLAIAPTQLHAGAWTQAPGGMYFKIAGLSFRSQDYLDAIGDRRERVAKPSMEELSDESISAYLEYGLHERLTLVATLPYKRLVYENTEVKVFKSDLLDTTITRIHPDEISSGLADLELRLRWRLLRNPAVVSLALGGKIPLGYDIDQDSIGSLDAGGLGLGLSPVDGADNKVPLGTGERDIDMRLLVGKSLYPLPGYLTSTVGYRKRGGAFSDEFFYGLEAGVTYKRPASQRRGRRNAHHGRLRRHGTGRSRRRPRHPQAGPRVDLVSQQAPRTRRRSVPHRGWLQYRQWARPTP